MTLRNEPIGDGAELVNVALRILQAWHGRPVDALDAHYAAGEWADAADLGDACPADAPEAQALYHAAVGVVCRWYGVANAAGFRRYLAQFGRGGPAHA